MNRSMAKWLFSTILICLLVSRGYSQSPQALVGSQKLITDSIICANKCRLMFKQTSLLTKLNVFAYEREINRFESIKLLIYRNSKNVLVDARLIYITQEAPSKQLVSTLRESLERLSGARVVMDGLDIIKPPIKTARMPDGAWNGIFDGSKCVIDVPYFRSDVGQIMIEQFHTHCPGAAMYLYEVSVIGEQTGGSGISKEVERVFYPGK